VLFHAEPTVETDDLSVAAVSGPVLPGRLRCTSNRGVVSGLVVAKGLFTVNPVAAAGARPVRCSPPTVIPSATRM
jgi:hypothetical protein